MFEIFINILIYMNMYWYLVPIVFIPAVYYIMLNILQFPLITNKVHEMVLILTPDKVRIRKVTDRYMPFFSHQKGIYWFDKPCSDVDTLNQIHTYISEINQPITKMDRRDNKVNDLVTNQSRLKQLSRHRILLLRNFKKHLHRHYTLVVDAENDAYKLTPTDQRQPLKVNFYHTLGVYVQSTIKQPQEQEIESASGQKLILQAITTQNILQQAQYVQEHSYYSSNYAFNLQKKILRIEKNYLRYLQGSMDPKVIAAILILVGAVAAGYLMTQVFSPANLLGEMPAG